MEQNGVRIIIGKGGMFDDSKAAFEELGGVYLAIIGGTAALETTWIERIGDVDLDDLNPESLWQFRIKGFGPLLVAMDALKRGSARRTTAVIPYYGYARQDRKSGPRTPISAKLVANLITSAGADRVLTLDLHAGQIQGFFDIPTDNLFAAPVFIKDIEERCNNQTLTVVSPDVGGVVRARAIAKRINADLAIIDKRRERAGVSEVMNIIGDVKDTRCILVDDIVDSAGTLCNAAVALMDAGATAVSAYVTHGVLSGGAVARVTSSPIDELVMTDSIQATEAVRVAHNIRQLTIAPLLGEAMSRISDERSVSSLFD
jgi:ribose-phosphate pyrophosphokinase